MTSAKQKSKSIFTNLQQRKPTFSSRPNYNQPFLSAALPGNQQGGSTSGRGQEFFFSRAVAAKGKDLPKSVSSTEYWNSQTRNILIHNPAIKGLFPPKEFQTCSQASRLQYFLENWEKLTSNPLILNIMKGYQILFLPVSIKKSCLPRISMTSQEEVLVDQEIEQMLRKGAIKVVQQDPNLFLNSIFVMPKKESGHRPVINLKNLDHYIPYSHFNMEGLFLVKETLQERD